MGRTNGKLIPFLRRNLEMKSFINLKYECEKEGVFSIELPRFEIKNCGQYEVILKEWYAFNEKLLKYAGYSKAKSVLQAALKKSIYLIPLQSIGKRRRFRFATSEEAKERQRIAKVKATNDASSELVDIPSVMTEYSLPTSPSVASSGYHSGNEDSGTIPSEMTAFSHPVSPSVASSGYHSGNEDSGIESNQFTEDMKMLDDLIEKYGPSLNDSFFNDDNGEKKSASLQNIQLGDENLYNMVADPDELIKSVAELKIIPVGSPGILKKYWLCTKKIIIESTLQLVCEMKVIENEYSGPDDGIKIQEGSVVIPNEVWEPGITYDLKNCFELDDKYYMFFSPNST